MIAIGSRRGSPGPRRRRRGSWMRMRTRGKREAESRSASPVVQPDALNAVDIQHPGFGTANRILRPAMVYLCYVPGLGSYYYRFFFFPRVKT